MVVTKELLSYMEVSEEEAWRTAWKNLRKEKFFIPNINDTILLKSSVKMEDMKTLDFSGMPPMYVMSNKNRDYGARVIF